MSPCWSEGQFESGLVLDYKQIFHNICMLSQQATTKQQVPPLVPITDVQIWHKNVHPKEGGGNRLRLWRSRRGQRLLVCVGSRLYDRRTLHRRTLRLRDNSSSRPSPCSGWSDWPYPWPSIFWAWPKRAHPWKWTHLWACDFLSRLPTGTCK